MDNSAIIARYKEIAAFLYHCLPHNIEIVVHDLSDLDRSLVAIYNEKISHRSVGAPLTDFALNIIRDKIYEKKPYVVNYSGMSQDGLRLRSSTFFIKNQQNQLIGLLCLNIDVSQHQRLLDDLQGLFGVAFSSMPAEGKEDAKVLGEDGYQEMFPTSITNMIDMVLKKNDGGVAASRLTSDEKARVVEALNEQGVFMLKGSIPAVSEKLHISEATVYRYLSKVKRQKNSK